MAKLLCNPIWPLNFHEQSKAKRTTCILWENTSFSRNFSLVQQNKRHRHNSGNDARKLDELQVITWMRREGYLLFYREFACQCMGTGKHRPEGWRLQANVIFLSLYSGDIEPASKNYKLLTATRVSSEFCSLYGSTSGFLPIYLSVWKSLKFLNHCDN